MLNQYNNSTSRPDAILYINLQFAIQEIYQDFFKNLFIYIPDLLTGLNNTDNLAAKNVILQNFGMWQKFPEQEQYFYNIKTLLTNPDAVKKLDFLYKKFIICNHVSTGKTLEDLSKRDLEYLQVISGSKLGEFNDIFAYHINNAKYNNSDLGTDCPKQTIANTIDFSNLNQLACNWLETQQSLIESYVRVLSPPDAKIINCNLARINYWQSSNYDFNNLQSWLQYLDPESNLQILIELAKSINILKKTVNADGNLNLLDIGDIEALQRLINKDIVTTVVKANL